MPVHPGDYIHRECGGVLTKTIGSQAPSAILNIIGINTNKFLSGYFATQSEEKDSVTKVQLLRKLIAFSFSKQARSFLNVITKFKWIWMVA